MTGLLPSLLPLLLLQRLLLRLLLLQLLLLLLPLRQLPHQPALGLLALVQCPLRWVGAVAPHCHVAAHLATPHRPARRRLVATIHQPAVTLLAGTWSLLHPLYVLQVWRQRRRRRMDGETRLLWLLRLTATRLTFHSTRLAS